MSKIEICKTCTKKTFDKAQGIVCSLTSAKPTFEERCDDYDKDEAATPVSTEKPRPNNERARIAILLVFIVMGIEIFSAFSSYWQYNLLEDIVNGETISQTLADANDTRESLVGIIYIIVFIISGITFIRWFRRAYYNLHLKVNHLSHPEKAAASCWFIPVVNLFRPYQIMKELYEETKVYLEKNGAEVSEVFNTRLLSVWWTIWIVNNFVGQILFRLSKHAESVDELMNLTMGQLISCVIGIPLALVTIKVIKDYSNNEYLLADVCRESKRSAA